MSSTKPPWVKSQAGLHPAFAPLSKEEAEKMALKAIADAQKFAEGQGMLFAGKDQKDLLNAERNRVHHKANAEAHARGWDKVVELNHLQRWADAAIELGKFDEAKAAIQSTRGRSLVRFFSHILTRPLPDDIIEYISKMLDDFKAMPKFADDVHKACRRPDSQECKCERETDEDEKGNTFALDRRYGIRRIFSPYHNQFVTIYQCRHCGFLNASAVPPERQAEYEAIRKKNEMAARSAIATNKPAPKGLSDAQVLKASE